jgi:hypothetical protein
MNGILYNTLPALIVTGIIAAILCLEVCLLIGRLLRQFRRKPPVSRLFRQAAAGIHLLAGTLMLCLLYAAFVEPYWPEIVTVKLKTPKLHNTTLRIVQISDLHCDPKARLEPRLPGLINSLKPDVIVFTGDAINSPEAVPLFQKTLAAMEAPLGKFAVRGNWDYRSGWAIFDNTGFQEMTLEAVRLEKDGEPFMLCGISYYNGRISQHALNQLDSNTWNFLIHHGSSLVPWLSDEPVDLYLCGHTHGGQVALPFYGALVTMSEHGKQYESGLYTVGKMNVYVNRGIGMGGLGPRVRFFARPEITLFEINPVP